MGFGCLQDICQKEPCTHSGSSFWTNQTFPIRISPRFGDLTFFPLFTYFLNRLLLSLITPPLHYYIRTPPPPISLTNGLTPAPTNGRLPTSADTHGQHLSLINGLTPAPTNGRLPRHHILTRTRMYFPKLFLSMYQCYLPTPFPSLLTSFTTRTHLPLFSTFSIGNIAIPRAEIRRSQLPLAPDF